VRRLTIPLLAAAFLAAACGGPSARSATSGTSGTNGMSGMDGMGDMPGMAAAPTPSPLREAAPKGNGLSASVNGYTLVLAADGLSFHINGPGGRTVTRYQPYESELMQVDVVRSDLTGYQHVDTAMRQDGEWVVSLPKLPPGDYRAYATFAAPDSSAGTPLVYQLSQPFTVPGSATYVTLPRAAASTTVGGYRVTLSGAARAGVPASLHLSFTRDGKPVQYFERYLDGYAHVTGFHVGDLAFAHLTPATGQGANLTTRALFPESGAWRLFVRFQATGAPLTADFTVEVS
jgi:hypothetical protein